MKEPQRQTITRHPDEPKLKIGETVSIKEGVLGLVLARYTPRHEQNEICYIVELLSNEGEKMISLETL